jgi:hypothetical protein
MIRRIEARISSIVGSWAFAGCAIKPIPVKPPPEWSAWRP